MVEEENRKVSSSKIQEAKTLHELFEFRCEASSSSPFLIIEDEDQVLRNVTFGELRERVRLIRRQLAVRGLTRGSVAILLLERSEVFVEAILAVWSLGAIAFVPNWRIPSTKLEELVQSTPSGFRHLICSWQFYKFAAEWKSNGVVDQAYFLLPSKLELDDSYKSLYEQSSSTSSSSQSPMVFLSRHPTHSFLSQEIEETRPTPGDIALILHSSGTTTVGLPKLCPTTHLGLLWNQRQTTHLLEESVIKQNEDGTYDSCVSLGMLPFYHTIGLLVDFLGTLYRGSKYTFPNLTTDKTGNDDAGFRSFLKGLLPINTQFSNFTTTSTLSLSPSPPSVASSAISARELLLSVSRFGATHLYCVPLVLHYFRDMMRSELQYNEDAIDILGILSGLKFIMTSGVKLDEELGHFFHERKIKVLQCYGMTELGGWVMLSGLSAGEFGCLRPPQEYIPYMRFEPLDDQNANVSSSEETDQLYQLFFEDCPSVIKCYFNNEGATSGAFERREDRLWFRTGDIFRKIQPKSDDSRTWWQSIGRIDDLIVHENGEKTNPIPLEISIEKLGWNVVSKAVLFGSGRPFCIAVIHLTSVGLLDEKTFNEVWRAIEQTNNSASDYSRVSRSAVVLLHNRVPLPLSPKGSLVRKQLGIMLRPLLDWVFGVGDTNLTKALNALDPQLKDSIYLLGVDSLGPSKKNFSMRKLVASLIASELVSSAEQSRLEQELMTKHRTLPFHNLGVDSAKAIVIRNKLARELERPLSGTLLFDHPTLESLVDFLMGSCSLATNTLPAAQRHEENIVVRGMSCRFAGINNVDEYWKALLDCRDLRRPLPAKRKADYSRGSFYVEETEKGYWMENIDLFDAEFFNISAAEAKRINPQQRLLLEVCWELLETSGETNLTAFGRSTSKRPRVGVFIGQIWNEYSSLKEEGEAHTPFDTLGSGGGSAAGRLSHVFGFTGPSIVIDTACSSSLMAIHLACKSLRDGECDFAIAGGVSLMLTSDSWGMTSASGMTAPSGVCKTFDTNADGMARGEGCGLVLLSRVGEVGSSPSLGIIKGSYANNNGNSSIGMHAPSKSAQIELAKVACRISGVNPSEVSFIEAHGTGTRIGDPIEIQALAEVYQGNDEDPRKSPLYVTSVKSNIGHTESAAGVAGLIKVLLCLRHHTLPPQLHLETLNPLLELERYRSGDLVIPTAEVSFDSLVTPPIPGKPLVAAVSSFGLIGTNVHMVLEESQAATSALQSDVGTFPCGLVTLSAKSKTSLDHLIVVMKKRWEQTNPLEIPNFCFTTNIERSHFPYRYSFVGFSGSKRDWPDETFDWQVNDASTTLPTIIYYLSGNHLSEYKPISWLANDRTYVQLLTSEPISTALHSSTKPSFLGTFLGIYLSGMMWTAWGVKPGNIFFSGVGAVVAECLQNRVTLEAALSVVRLLDELYYILLHLNGEQELAWESFVGCYENLRKHPEVMKWSDRFEECLRRESTSFQLPNYLSLMSNIAENLKITSEAIILEFSSTDGRSQEDSSLLTSFPALLLESIPQSTCVEVLSRLYVAGVDIDFEAIHSGHTYHKVALPTYHFDRKSFWIYEPSIEPSYGYQSQEKRTSSPSNDTYDEIKTSLLSIVGELLGLRFDSSEDLSQRSVFSLGVNSLMVPLLQEAIFARLGRTIETGELYSKSSISELASFLLDNTQVSLDSNERSTIPRRQFDDPIVIAASAFRFPRDINDAESFWNILHSGESALTRQPLDPNHPLYNDIQENRCPPFGGFLRDIQKFDAEFFECSPKEAHAMDPSHRLMLELAWETLERGGVSPTALEGSNTGVYIGTSLTSEYPSLRSEKQMDGSIGSYGATGVAASMISGRISHFLKLNGPSLTLDTACSSSLVAFHLACESLLSGECNLALAGGINLMLSPTTTIGYAEAGLLSPDGNCCPFGSNANGIVRSEGLVMVLLMRQSTALANGHSILGTVLSSAVNNNGGGSSITVPNSTAQERLMRTALARAQHDTKRQPTSVQFVEAHGTGTKLGDPIEIQALVAVYSSPSEPRRSLPLRISSVKANLGHTEAAAGLAGLVKVLLCFQHEAIPKQINLWKLNDSIDSKKHNLEIPMDLLEWKSTSDYPRVAAVSSFGISGTNAHAILQEPPSIKDTELTLEALRADWSLITISAKTESSLSDLLVRYHHYLTKITQLPSTQRNATLANTCFTSNVGRAHFHHRTAVLVDPNVKNLSDLLTMDRTVFHGVSSSSNSAAERPKWGVLFSDFNGEQFENELFAGHPLEKVYRTELNSCYARMGATATKVPLLVSLFVKSLSAYQTVTALLSPPSISFGTGQGELLAATAAGVIPLSYAFRVLSSLDSILSAWESCGELLPIMTLSVFGSLEALQDLEGLAPQSFVVVSEYNDKWVSICGPVAVLEAIQPYLTERRIGFKEGFDSGKQALRTFGWEALIYLFQTRERTTSPSLHRAFEGWDKTVTQGRLQPVTRRFASSSLRKVVDAGSILLGDWLSGLVRRPIGYFETIQRWTQFLDPRLVVFLHVPTDSSETISPLALLMRSLQKQQRQVKVSSTKLFLDFDVESRDRRQCIARLIAQFYTAGLDIDWPRYYHLHSASNAALRLDSTLPTYPFQHTKAFWFDGKMEYEMLPASSIPTYELSWVLNPTPVFPGFLLMLFAQVVFVVFADTLGIADAIRTSLAPSRVIMIFGSETSYSENRENNHIFMDWYDEASYDKLLDSTMVFQPKSKKHYVFIDMRSLSPSEDQNYQESAKRKCLQLSYLLRMVDRITPSKHLTPLYEKKLFVITKQVHALAGHQQCPLSVDQAAIWGLCNSASLEYPGLDLLRIDIDTSESSQYQHQLKLEIISSLKFASLEDRIAYRDGRRYTQRLKRGTMASMISSGPTTSEDEEHLLSSEKTYLITGAFGGLGWSFAKWMVKMGARHLILLGRKLPSNGSTAILSELQHLKRIANVVVLEVNVFHRNELIQKLQSCNQAYNMPSIAGVIHSAGAIRDALLKQVPRVDEYYQTCFEAKVQGAVNLYEAIQQQEAPIEFFLTFSSSACWLGSVGQCNYSAANMFMDTWTQDLRINHNIPALAINWGPWELGMTARLHPRSLETLQEKFSLVTEKIGQAALEIIIRNGPLIFPPSIGLFNMLSWDSTKPFYSELSIEDLNKSMLAYDQPRIQPKEHNTTTSNKLTGVNIYQPLDTRDSNEVLKHVALTIKDVLGLANSTESFDPDRLLVSYGFDSLMAIELSKRLSITTKQQLSPGLVYDYPTASKITAYLLRSLNEITFSKALPPVAAPSVEESRGTSINDLKVAIIGVSCRMPGGVQDLSSFWELLTSKNDGIAEAPESRRKEYYGPDGAEGAKMASKLGGFVREVETFDASFFKISKQEAMLLDPQHRMLLEVSYLALENAGKGDLSQLAGSKTGVFIGVGGRDYEWLLRRHQPAAVDSGYFLTGNSSSCAVGRLSFFYGFTGPAISVDTACSSSLVSVHLASKALLARECDMALAGGVNLILNSDYTVSLSKMGVLSPDGRCKSYSSSANGYVRSEGCGIVVLKRLSDALRDHDEILAVIRGSAINQDGNSNGLTAPNGPAQERVIRSALDDAQLQPKDVAYIEGHGSSTSIGDAIELKALRSAFSTAQRSQPLLLSSVKAKVGHLEIAAGAAGLLSAVLVLKHQSVPALLHYTPPSSSERMTDILLPVTSVSLPTQSQFVGVSSFGISGTNSHVILEVAPKVKPLTKKQTSTSRPWFIITISGQDKPILQNLLQQLLHKLRSLKSNGGVETRPEDLEATFNGKRALLSHRIAITFQDVQSLTKILEDACAGVLDGPEIYYGVTATPPSMTFVLSYSLYTPSTRDSRERMLKIAAIQIEMLRSFIVPELLDILSECFRTLGSLLASFSDLNTDVGFFFQYTSMLQDVLKREKAGEPEDMAEFVFRFVFCEATFFAVSVCLSELFIKWGVVPAAALGLGVGEYIAAYLAGVLSLGDVLKLLIARAQDAAGIRFEPLSNRQGLLATHLSKAISQVNLNKYSRFPLLPSRNAIFSPSHWVSHWNKDLELAFDGNEEQLKLALKQRVAPALQGAVCILEIIPHDSCSPSEGVIEEVVSSNDKMVYHRSPCVRRIARMKKENEAILEEGKHYLKELLNTVAYFHVLGHVSVNWKAFSSSFPARGTFSTELAIPYPFQRRRYWPIEEPSSSSQTSTSTTPSASRRSQTLVRDLFEFDTSLERNSKEFSGSVSFNHPLLFQTVRDHNLHGIIVVPAAFYVALTIDGLFAFFASLQSTSATNLLKSRIHSITIQEMQFHQVLLLSEEEFTAGVCPTLKMLLINNSENSQELRYQFEFSSHHKRGAATHCTGTISVKAVSAVSSVQLPSTLENSNRLELREFYSLYHSIEYFLGPSFRWVQSVVMGGSNAEESLAQLNLPSDATNTSAFILHPGLIDSFFQSVNLGKSTVTSAPYIPARIESATIFLLSRDTIMRQENWKPDRNVKVHSITKREESVTSNVVFQNTDLVGNLKVTFIPAGQKALHRALAKQMASHCYELTWSPSQEPSIPSNLPPEETIFALSDSAEILVKLKVLLGREVSIQSIHLCSSTSQRFQHDGLHTLELSPTLQDDFRNLLLKLTNNSQRCRLLFMFSPPSQDAFLVSEESMIPSQVFDRLMKRYLLFSDLLKSLVEEVSLASKLQITLVTTNVNKIDDTLDQTSVNVLDSPLCGLFSVFAAETPFTCQLIDVSNLNDPTWTNELLRPLHDESNLVYRNGRRYCKRLTRSTQAVPFSQLRLPSHKLLFRSDGCYLITGGLGGVAQTLINYLIDNGAGSIVLIGRRPLPAGVDFSWASARGCLIRYLQGDVSIRDSVKEAVRMISEEGKLPLRGVFHCAGILDDALLLRLDAQRMISVMKPKVLGALNLHFETLHLQLDHFVLFSSVASILGSSGQSSYVAANCFLDALSHARRVAGLPSFSQNWGPWSLGLGSDVAEKKWKLSTISRLVPLQGYAAFDLLFGSQYQPHKSPPAQLSVLLVGSWDSFLSSQKPSVAEFQQSLLSELLDKKLPTTKRFGEISRQSVGINPQEIAKQVKKWIAEAVNLPESSIKDDHLIEELGIDSMLSIDLRNQFSRELGLRLPATLLFEHKRLSQLVQHLTALSTTTPSVSTTLSPASTSHVPSVSSLSHDSSHEEDSIALVGMSCRFPGGVRDIESLWKMLSQGIDGVTVVPSDRWNPEDFYNPVPGVPGKTTSKWGGFIEGFDNFDHEFFGYTADEAETIDPQQRLLLETSYEALEMSGTPMSALEGKDVGVFAGIVSNDFEFIQSKNKPDMRDVSKYFETGKSMAVGRISRFFGLEGPCMAIDTACSSGIVALHLAVESMRSKECEMALVGTVNLVLTPTLAINYSQSNVLAHDGRVKSFDSSADGFVRSDGVAFLVLKPLREALSSKDTVYAIIRGTSVSQVGKTNMLMAPNSASQEKLARRALSVANVHPSQVSMIEAHGSGTAIGDAIEMQALLNVYGGTSRATSLSVGSVKTNIGHPEAVAGLAGLLKVVTALHHEIIPHNLHFKTPHPYLPPLEASKAIIPTTPIPWPASSQQKRFGAVNTLGYSGVIAHAVVEGHSLARISGPGLGGHDHCSVCSNEHKHGWRLLVLSAKDEETLKVHSKNLQNYLMEKYSGVRSTAEWCQFLEDVCYTSCLGRTHFHPHRLAALVHCQHSIQDTLRGIQHPSSLLGEEETSGLVNILEKQYLGKNENERDWKEMVTEFYDQLRRECPCTSLRKIPLPPYPFHRTRFKCALSHPNGNPSSTTTLPTHPSPALPSSSRSGYEHTYFLILSNVFLVLLLLAFYFL